MAEPRVWTDGDPEPVPPIGENFPVVRDRYGIRFVGDERFDGFEGWRSDSHGVTLWCTWGQLAAQRGPLTADRSEEQSQPPKAIGEADIKAVAEALRDFKFQVGPITLEMLKVGQSVYLTPEERHQIAHAALSAVRSLEAE